MFLSSFDIYAADVIFRLMLFLRYHFIIDYDAIISLMAFRFSRYFIFDCFHFCFLSPLLLFSFVY